MPFVEFKNVSKIYGSGEGAAVALNRRVTEYAVC
jgi:hypothetical protein